MVLESELVILKLDKGKGMSVDPGFRHQTMSLDK